MAQPAWNLEISYELYEGCILSIQIIRLQGIRLSNKIQCLRRIGVSWTLRHTSFFFSHSWYEIFMIWNIFEFLMSYNRHTWTVCWNSLLLFLALASFFFNIITCYQCLCTAHPTEWHDSACVSRFLFFNYIFLFISNFHCVGEKSNKTHLLTAKCQHIQKTHTNKHK